MELKDEEIKKALEDFYHRAENTNLSYHIFENEREALKDAIAIINRQQADIERLNGNLFTISNACMQRRNEAIKEFAERLKKRAKLVARIKDNTRIWAVTEDDIDRVDAEMVGGDDA